jgi:HSP20 family protein
MTSFWAKLKEGRKKKREDEMASEKKKIKEAPDGFLQLDVDICQTPFEIIIYAPMSGIEIKDLEILMADENDIITIQGKTERPGEPGQEEEVNEVNEENEESEQEKKWLVQECKWGSFFRQIILPDEVDVDRIDAKLKEGVLILKLPLLNRKTKRKKLKIIDIK